MAKKTVKDLSLAGKKVFTRVDFNVPRNESGEITDDTKIKAALPTIEYILEQGASVILASHLGRPKGQVKDNLRLDSVAQRLSDLLGRNIQKADEVVGPEVTEAAAGLKPGDILLLENVRFHPGEEKNEPELAKAYADLADIFVSDAFGTAHRAHASNTGIAAHLPSVAGLLMTEEVENLSKSLHNAKRPLVAIIGGSKVADKISVLKNFLEIADSILLGGGMANTFLRAKDYNMGRSLLEEDKLMQASEIMQLAANKDVNLCLPVDLVVADEVSADADAEDVIIDSVPDGKMALDIGPKTREIYADLISKAGTIVWNGPLGVFEVEPFARGTMDIAIAVANSQAFSIIGGGDVVAAVEKAGVADKISHLSTGGGATLEFWEGKELPGIAALEDK
ncbi:MAG: phosphoglycerate kinase [Clostridiales bacterium]|nr:phosphoglycerate kinase [Clostridiales bacterium]